jgi:YD repeat-containing protein
MTVVGQAAVTYGYDSAHRLTSITQGTETVSLTYDNADHRNTVTYPNSYRIRRFRRAEILKQQPRDERAFL